MKLKSEENLHAKCPSLEEKRGPKVLILNKRGEIMFKIEQGREGKLRR